MSNIYYNLPQVNEDLKVFKKEFSVKISNDENNESNEIQNILSKINENLPELSKNREIIETKSQDKILSYLLKDKVK